MRIYLPNKNHTMSKYKLTPETIEDFKNNVDFQSENLQGWLSIGSYESALIKARCLVEDLQLLVEKINQSNDFHPQPNEHAALSS